MHYYQPHKIYISESTCKQIDDFIEKVTITSLDYSMTLATRKNANTANDTGSAVSDELDKWKEGYKSLRAKGAISNILQELKKELRILIVVK